MVYAACMGNCLHAGLPSLHVVYDKLALGDLTITNHWQLCSSMSSKQTRTHKYSVALAQL